MSDKYVVQMQSLLDADRGSIRITNDGYLTATVRAARTGIQEYRGYEVGRPDLETVRVYRPPEQVFRKDSMQTYAHRPVTNDHPPVAVDSENWKRYAVGQTGDEVARDGDFVTVPLVLMDAGMIRDWRDGKKQLSLGYQTELLWDSGTTPDGETYDAVQTDIRANHLAVVVAARGGPDLTIGDDNSAGDQDMNAPQLKSVTVDGLTVEMTDIAAQQVTRVIAARDQTVEELKKQIAELEKKLKEMQSSSDAKSASDAATIKMRDDEIVILKKQVADSAVTPAVLDALVSERSSVVAAGRKILGDKLTVDGKTVSEIRRQVVDAKMGASAKDWSEDAVSAAFATITKDAGADGTSSYRDALADVVGTSQASADSRAQAYAERDKNLTNAWKGGKAA